MGESTHLKNPWDIEPKAQEWTDVATGLKCLILKHPEFQTLCGYVRIMRSHPLFDKSYRNFERGINVHGGVTFARRARGSRYMKRGYWVGFDCAHYMDMNPGLDSQLRTINGFKRILGDAIYRDSTYVRSEVESLALQLHKKGLQHE